MPTLTYHQLNKFNHDGIFWFPDNSDDTFAGRLDYDSENGVTVHLIKPASIKTKWARWAKSFESNDQPLLLCGNVNPIGPVTLFNGFLKQSNPGSSGPMTEIFFFNQALLGIISEQPQNERFDKISVLLEGFSAWTAINPFKFPDHFTDMKQGTVSVLRPESIEISLPESNTLKISWTISGPNWAITQTEARIKSQPWVTVHFSNPQSLEDSDSILHRAIGLFEILSNHRFKRLETTLESPNHRRPYGKDNKSIPINIHNLGTYFNPNKHADLKYPNDALFNLSQLSDIQSCFDQWFSLYGKCENTLNTLSAVRADPGGYAETEFFIFASIAESLHRELYPSVKLFSRKLSARAIETVLAEIPDQHHGTVRATLGRINAMSFNQRLEALMVEAGTIMPDVVGDIRDQADFRRQIVRWRNEEAHRLQAKPEDESRNGIDYVRTTAKLKVLIDYVIFSNIGIDKETITKTMRGSNHYWFYASNKTWPWRIK